VPSYEIDDFAAITEAIRAQAGSDVIINYSTGAIGVPLEKRIAYLRALKPDIGALNMGSMNYAKYSRRRKDFVFKTVFENSFDTIIELCTAMRESGIKPEHECFDSGHIANLDPLLDMGLLDAPLQISCVMGVSGGIRPHGRAGACRRRPRMGRHRDLATAVGAGGRGADAGRQRARRAGGQLLPPGRGDGALQRRPRGAGAADVRRRGAAAGDGRRSPRAPGPVVSGALEGIRVLDLSRLLPGGFCSGLLADFGADVLKVEDTGLGDYVRWAPPRYEGAEASAGGALFLALNRNKRSIRIDLKSDAGREVLLRLVRESDVLLEGFRPGVMERLGVGYERLREENPRLVYCAITGYGQDGPYRDRSGHDMNYLGLVGLLGLTGEKEGPPVQSAGQIADLGGGALMAAVGILVALREREVSGEGQLVDVSMADGALSWLTMVAARMLAEEVPPARGGLELAGGLVCYRPYACADGHVTLGALEPKFWQAFCRGVGREDLIEHHLDPAGSETQREVEAIFAARTRDEWAAFAGEHDCCLEPVLDLDEALDSELVRAREMVVEIDQPGAERPVRLLGVPIKLSRTPGDPARAPGPALGQDTRAVLEGLGYPPEEIERLLAEGAVAGPAGDSIRGSFMG
jgi:alpha-methylacyl-CoA racemase